MKQTASDAMSTWNEFIAWCEIVKKKTGFYSSIQDFLLFKNQEKLSC